MELEEVVRDVAAALVSIDSCGIPFKHFHRGVGPYGEPQLIAAVAKYLNSLTPYDGSVQTKREPHLLIAGQWALEFKLARPFGDNGKEAENWSVNLLHPYSGNISLVGDCLKLSARKGPERNAVIVVGYEHSPPKIQLEPLLGAFELIATKIARARIGKRIEIVHTGLSHPVHQQFVLAAWEVEQDGSPTGNDSFR